MKNKLVKVIESLSSSDENVILAILIKGIGNGNVTKEIVENMGATVDLKMSFWVTNTFSLEIWSAEYQEQVTILVHPENYQVMRAWKRKC